MHKMQETRVQSLGWEDPLEEELATHSSILAWRIPWTEELGRLWSKASQRVGHNWVTEHIVYHIVTVKQEIRGLYKGWGRFSAVNYIGEMLSIGQAIIFTNGLFRDIFTVSIQEENKQHFPLDHRDFYVHSTSWNVLENTDQNQYLHFMIDELKTQRWERTCRKSLGWMSRHVGCVHRELPRPSLLWAEPCQSWWYCETWTPCHTGTLWFYLEIWDREMPLNFDKRNARIQGRAWIYWLWVQPAWSP